jgi:SAM-dependent methyltransferase
MRLSSEIQAKLRCPATNSKLLANGSYLESTLDPNCRYPIIDGIPILIDDRKSIFAIADFIDRKSTTFDLNNFDPNRNNFKKLLRRLVPDISVNIKAKQNYQEFIAALPPTAKILVIGGSIQGRGMEEIYANAGFEIVGSDVSFGPEAKIVSDAHDLPFVGETFDGVIVQAVLEHVLEPQRCTSEIHRVLKPSGIVYAETPFMQQVHMRQYDFTRFTHLGHRRLFRQFEELSSGPTCGTGMALAWSYRAFLTSLTTSKPIAKILVAVAGFTSFFWKYFDYVTIDRPESYDAASGYYFLGKKSNYCLSDRELLAMYKGAM